MLEVIPVSMRAIRAEMRGLAQPELSIAQFRILARLHYKVHSNKEIAEWMGISTAAMSRAIDNLVKAGLVERSVTPHDRRELFLSLTAKGKKKFQSIEDATKKKLMSRLKPLSPAKLKMLEEGLAALKEVFDEL